MPSRTNVSLFAALIVTIAIGEASAQTIGWHPSSPLYLGANFDPDNPREAKVPCLKEPTKNAVAVDGGAPSTEFKSTLLSERRELYNAFSVSASFSASSGLAGGGGSISSISEVSFDSDTVVWSLQAKSNFGRTAVSNVELKGEFANLAPQALVAICGTHFVVMDRREAVVAAVFVFRSISQKTRDDLKAALSASWTGGSFSSNLSNELKKSLERTEVSFVFLAKGGEGLSGTSGFVGTFDKFDELRAKIGEYIAAITREKSPAAEYFIAKLPVVPPMTLLLDAKERTLSNAWADYLILDQMVSESRRTLSNIDRFWYLDPTVLRQYLEGVSKDASNRIENLAAIVRECQDDKSKCTYARDSTIPSISWPSVNPHNNASGYGCTNDDCTGPAHFLLRIRGPSVPQSIRMDRIGLAFPGGNMGYNCRYQELPVLVADGVQFKCSISFKKSTLNREGLDLHVFDLVNGVTALRIPFSDAAPDFSWP